MKIDYGLILTIIGTILAVIGIIQSIKNQRKKIPFFDISNSGFLPTQQRQNFQKSDLEQKNNENLNFNVTRLGIWNDGIETIYENDIPKENPFIIEIAKPFKIFEVILISKKFEYIKINTNLDQNRIYIDFNYLEKKSWFILEIKHSGSYFNCFKTKGKVIGGKELKRVPNSSSNNQKYEPLLYDFLAIIGGLIILFLVYKYTESFNLFTVIFILVGLMFGVTGTIRIFEIRLPKDLKKELGK